MKCIFVFILSLAFLQINAQEILYQDDFDSNVLAVGGSPNGYSISIDADNFQIVGDGSAGQWASMGYSIHDGSGEGILLDASSSPKLYIRAKGSMQPNLRIDFQDETGYMSNLDPLTMELTDSYTIYEYDFNGHLLDGAYGGPCTTSPCVVDPSRLQTLIFFVNAPVGGYAGTIDIDWISIGAPLEDDGTFAPEHDIRYNQVSYIIDRPK